MGTISTKCCSTKKRSLSQHEQFLHLIPIRVVEITTKIDYQRRPSFIRKAFFKRRLSADNNDFSTIRRSSLHDYLNECSQLDQSKVEYLRKKSGQKPLNALVQDTSKEPASVANKVVPPLPFLSLLKPKNLQTYSQFETINEPKEVQAASGQRILTQSNVVQKTLRFQEDSKRGPSPAINIERVSSSNKKFSQNNIKALSEVSKRSNIQFSELDPHNMGRESMTSSFKGLNDSLRASPQFIMKKLKSFEKNDICIDKDNTRVRQNMLQRVKTQTNKSKKGKRGVDQAIDTTKKKKKVQSINNYLMEASLNSLDMTNTKLKVQKNDFMIDRKNINNDSIVFIEKILPDPGKNSKDMRDVLDFTKTNSGKSEKPKSKIITLPINSEECELKKPTLKDKTSLPLEAPSPPCMAEYSLESFSKSPQMLARKKRTQISSHHSSAASQVKVFQSQEKVSMQGSNQSSDKIILKATTKEYRYEKKKSSDTAEESKLLYAQTLAPSIIITRPPEELDEEPFLPYFAQHSNQHLQRAAEESDNTTSKSRQDKRLKFKIKKGTDSFIIEIMDDQLQNMVSNPGKIKVVRKRSSSTKEQQNQKTGQISESFTETIRTSGDSTITANNQRIRMQNPQLLKFINTIITTNKQIQQQRKRIKDNEDLTSKIIENANDILTVKRLKTLAEVDEDEEKSCYDNQHNEINGNSLKKEQQNVTQMSKSQFQGYSEGIESVVINRMRQGSKKDKNLKIVIQDLSPKKQLEKKLIEYAQKQRQIKERAQSKNIIRMIRQQNQEMLQQSVSQIILSNQQIIIQDQEARNEQLNIKKSTQIGSSTQSDQYKIKFSKPQEEQKESQNELMPSNFTTDYQYINQNTNVIGLIPRLKSRVSTEPQILQWDTQKLHDQQVDPMKMLESQDDNKIPSIIIKRATEQPNGNNRRAQTPLLVPVNGFRYKRSSDDVNKGIEDIKDRKIRMQIRQQLFLMSIRLAQQGSITSSYLSSRDQESIDINQTDSASCFYEEDEYDIEYESDSCSYSNFISEGNTPNLQVEKSNHNESSSSSVSPAKLQIIQTDSNSIRNTGSLQQESLQSNTESINPDVKFESKPSLTFNENAPHQIKNALQKPFSQVHEIISELQLKTQSHNSYAQPSNDYLRKQSPVQPNLNGQLQITTITKNTEATYQTEAQSNKILQKLQVELKSQISRDKKFFSQPISMSPNINKPHSLLTPENLQKLGTPKSSGPKSITTNSVISSRKNGKKKINQYIINYHVGEGKFSKVFNCLNEKDQKTYAMKVVNKRKLNRQFNISQKSAYNFVETEIAILKKLDHPNVLTLFEIIQDPNINKLYLVTDFVKNGNLSERIQKQTLEMDDIRNYFRDLISALEYCHECAKIIHRDIKPENILIDDNNRVKLADFGVSHIMENDDDTINIRVGTNFYFSPEICKGGNYRGKPSDIWACGVVLYFMATKKMPFIHHNLQELYRLIQNQEPNYSEIKDPDLVDLLKKILIKDFSKRITIEDIKLHPWILWGGPMPNLEMNQIVITQQDLKSVITKVVKKIQVVRKFHKTISNNRGTLMLTPELLSKIRENKL